MNWQELKSKAVSWLPKKVEKPLAAEENTSKAVQYSFDFPLEDAKKIDSAAITRLITLNPWSALGSKPVVAIAATEKGRKELQVRFKAISKSKAKLIEENIIAYLEGVFNPEKTSE